MINLAAGISEKICFSVFCAIYTNLGFCSGVHFLSHQYNTIFEEKTENFFK